MYNNFDKVQIGNLSSVLRLKDMVATDQLLCPALDVNDEVDRVSFFVLLGELLIATRSSRR